MTKIAELYGLPTFSRGKWKAAVKRQECPLLNRKCLKNRKSEADLTIGTCTMIYGRKNPRPVMICPFRLLIAARSSWIVPTSSRYTNRGTNFASFPRWRFLEAASITA